MRETVNYAMGGRGHVRRPLPFSPNVLDTISCTFTLG